MRHGLQASSLVWRPLCEQPVKPWFLGRRPHTANNGADDAASKRARYALLGNAVSVCVARWIGCQLMEPYKCDSCFLLDTPHACPNVFIRMCVGCAGRWLAAQQVAEATIACPNSRLGTMQW